MATARLTWFGAVVTFDHGELVHITNNLNFVSAVGGAIAAAFFTTGVGAAAAIVPGAIAAALRLGAASLALCNSKQAGIRLFVLYVGVPWCRSR
jgi:hypothetical protein